MRTTPHAPKRGTIMGLDTAALGQHSRIQGISAPTTLDISTTHVMQGPPLLQLRTNTAMTNQPMETYYAAAAVLM
jgi:hypothetical protein